MALIVEEETMLWSGQGSILENLDEVVETKGGSHFVYRYHRAYREVMLRDQKNADVGKIELFRYNNSTLPTITNLLVLLYGIFLINPVALSNFLSLRHGLQRGNTESLM